MPRPSADYNTRTKGARAKLDPRAKPYYRHIAPNKTLGYIRRGGAAGSWVVREWEGGAYRFRTLGAADDIAIADGRDVLTFDQALQAASKSRAVEPVGRLTVDQAIDRYLDALAARSKHTALYRAIAKRHISGELGRRRVDRLTKTDIEAWLGGLVREDGGDDPEARRRSQDTANRVLTILKAALNAAFADEANQIPTDAAWRRVRPFQRVARARQVNIDATQVRTLIAKAAKLNMAFAALLEAAYLTGARMGELRAASVRDLDAKRSTLRVDGKTGPRVVTLTNEAAAFLQKQTVGKLPTAPLLPDSDGNRWPLSGHRRTIKRAAELAELPADTCVYSLRHAHASRAIEAGMPLSLLAENLGTSLLMLQRNYAHVLARTRRDVIQQTGPKLRRVK
jgi:integrase